MTSKTKKLTKEELTQMADKERRERAEACNVELQALLQKHECILQAEPTFVLQADGTFSVSSRIGVIPQ